MANYRDPQQTLLIKTKVMYAAAKLFLQKGFSETTVKEIAQEAGVSISIIALSVLVIGKKKQWLA